MGYVSKGFTLIELLVVIAVLGVLAGGVLIAINPLQQIRRVQDTQIKNDIGQVTQALQSYYTLNQRYPATLDELVTNGDLKQLTTTELEYTTSGDCSNYPYTGCEATVKTALGAPTGENGVWQ